MKDLQDIIETMSLADFSQEFKQQIQNVRSHPNVMKLYIMLCIMVENAFSELDKVNTGEFVEKLQIKIDKLKAVHEKNKDVLKAHVNENANICDRFDSYPQELDNLKSSIDNLIAEYDKRISEIIKSRDSLSVFQAKKNNNGIH